MNANRSLCQRCCGPLHASASSPCRHFSKAVFWYKTQMQPQSRWQQAATVFSILQNTRLAFLIVFRTGCQESLPCIFQKVICEKILECFVFRKMQRWNQRIGENDEKCISSKKSKLEHERILHHTNTNFFALPQNEFASPITFILWASCYPAIKQYSNPTLIDLWLHKRGSKDMAG